MKKKNQSDDEDETNYETDCTKTLPKTTHSKHQLANERVHEEHCETFQTELPKQM